MFPGQCGNTAFFFKSQPDQFHFEFRGIVFPGKSFFSAHEVSTCKISGCLSYRILDSGPDGTQTTLTDNRSSMKRSEKLKKYVEKELSGIRVSGRAEEEKLGYTLRNIQDEMFAYRASCPPVPNGIQLIMKPKNERIYVDYFETNLKELHLQE